MIGTLATFAFVALSTQEVVAPGPAGELKGIWEKAGDPAAPVAIVIPGSGPTDRDGNSPLGINAGSYRLLAEGLAERGIATVRIDKRGMFASTTAAADPNAVTIDDYVADIRSWVKAIRAEAGAECLWLLGHSEGGLVALAAAQREPAICGLILVATAGRPMGDVLKGQLQANPANAPFLPEANRAIDALARGERVDENRLAAPLRPLFDPALQDFLVSTFSLDPVTLIGAVEKPILILQGGSDLQVGVSDAQALKAAAPSAKLVELPDTNHVLKEVPRNDSAANIATYADSNLPLAPGVVEAIEDFMKLPDASN